MCTKSSAVECVVCLAISKSSRKRVGTSKQKEKKNHNFTIVELSLRYLAYLFIGTKVLIRPAAGGNKEATPTLEEKKWKISINLWSNIFFLWTKKMARKRNQVHTSEFRGITIFVTVSRVEVAFFYRTWINLSKLCDQGCEKVNVILKSRKKKKDSLAQRT